MQPPFFKVFNVCWCVFICVHAYAKWSYLNPVFPSLVWSRSSVDRTGDAEERQPAEKRLLPGGRVQLLHHHAGGDLALHPLLHAGHACQRWDCAGAAGCMCVLTGSHVYLTGLHILSQDFSFTHQWENNRTQPNTEDNLLFPGGKFGNCFIIISCAILLRNSS